MRELRPCNSVILALCLVGFALVATPSPALESDGRETGKCSLCLKDLVRTYYSIPGLPEKYCEVCHEKRPRCRFCGRPAFATDPREAAVCTPCSQDRLRPGEDPDGWFQMLRRYLDEDLNLAIRSPLSLDLLHSLETISSQPSDSPLLELGAFVSEPTRGRLVVLEGLPRCRLIETIAHELAHAWQRENSPPDQDLRLKEGFAQWVAAQALRKYRCTQALAVLEARPDFYGQGYRELKRLEREQGRNAVLKAARENR